MAEFVQTMKDWRRMCKAYTTDDESCCEGCRVVDFHECGCGAIFEMNDSTDWQRYADAIAAWAAEHPEPVYPTWEQFIAEMYLRSGRTKYHNITEWEINERISADIAQKLGIEPKEG